MNAPTCHVLANKYTITNQSPPRATGGPKLIPSLGVVKLIAYILKVTENLSVIFL